MIHRVPHFMSEGLRQEIEAHEQATREWTDAGLQQTYATPEVFFGTYMTSGEGMQYPAALRQVPLGARILDIGVGYGLTTIYLASRGYYVTAVEPAPSLCSILDRLARFYGFSIDIYNTTAEAIDRLP